MREICGTRFAKGSTVKPLNYQNLGGVTYDANIFSVKESDKENKKYCLETQTGNKIYFNDQKDNNNIIRTHNSNNFEINNMDDFEFYASERKSVDIKLINCNNSFIDIADSNNDGYISANISPVHDDYVKIVNGHGNVVKMDENDGVDLYTVVSEYLVRGEGTVSQDSYLM